MMMTVSRAVRIFTTAWLVSLSTSALPSLSSSLDDGLTTPSTNPDFFDAEQDHSVVVFDAQAPQMMSSTPEDTPETSSSAVEVVKEEDSLEFWPWHHKNKTVVPDDNKKNKTNDETCAAQADCSACGLHSHLCHWCAHDNSCHAIGSIYGCITGVNCFSNDRCKRQDPDPIEDTSKYAHVGVVPMVLALVMSGLAFCCLSFGFCLACGIKGAYDDLAEIAAMESRPFVIPIQRNVDMQPMNNDDAQRDDAAATAAAEVQEDGQVNYIASSGGNSNYIQMDDNGESSPLLFTSVAGPKTNRPSTVHMQRCFNACTLCYVVTVGIIGAAVFGTVRYYPKIPVYSVCSDQIAWKSLIDSIAAVKVDASFEILISVANPNYVDAVLDMGKGTFKHNNAFVGTFEIPPALVKAMSISDLMIIARFTPEKHEALAIVEEYYRGKLILHIDTQASIRVPAVFNYTYVVDVKDMIVNANEKDDRTLCKCPTWDDIRNTTTTTNLMALELPSMFVKE